MQKTNLVFRVLSLFLGLLLVVTLLPGTLLAQGKNERAVRAIINDLVRGGNSVDPAVVKGALRHFSPGVAALYSPFGKLSVAQLPSEIDKELSNLSARKFTAKPYTVYMDGRIAWTTFDWTAESTAKDGSRQALAGRSTLTFAKEGKTWRIKHLHNSLPTSPPANKAARQAEAEAVIATERAIWDTMTSRQPEHLGQYLTDDVSYFDDNLPYRVEGKQAFVQSAEDWLARAEMRSHLILNPSVQVFGESALLTYHYRSSGTSAGEAFAKSGKASVIFVKGAGGAWEARHYHLSGNR